MDDEQSTLSKDDFRQLTRNLTDKHEVDPKFSAFTSYTFKYRILPIIHLQDVAMRFF